MSVNGGGVTVQNSDVLVSVGTHGANYRLFNLFGLKWSLNKSYSAVKLLICLNEHLLWKSTAAAVCPTPEGKKHLLFHLHSVSFH